MLIIIQLSDPTFMRQFCHATCHEPTATNPEQGLLVFKVDEAEPLLQELTESGVCGFKVLFPTSPNPCQYISEIRQRGHTTFYRTGQGISETDHAKATRFDNYLDALQYLAAVLNQASITLSEPVEIRIAPAPDDAWTIEEILAREG